ncbi:MAG: hypothetical protein ACM359_10035 [Bacillota bacterium]
MKRKLASLLVLLLSVPVWAGGTSHWTHTNEAEFKKGKFHNVVATNLGDVKLSRAVKMLLEQDPRVTAVYALVEGKDGAIYAATGPQGIVLQLKGEKVSTVATLEDGNVFSLLVDREGNLLMGTGGEQGRILRLELGKPGAKPTEVFKAEGVQYIWKMVQTEDGMLYAATGPNGQIIEVQPDGTHSVLLDSNENNILSLITDGKDTLYAGTDPNGLVYRINRKTKDVFVLYDAPETEISALVLDSKGNLYAGTGQAGDSDEGGTGQAGEMEKGGRPDGGDNSTPLPTTRPSEPKRPSEAKPSSIEPDAIPRGSLQLMLLGAPAKDLEDEADSAHANAIDQPSPIGPGLKTPASPMAPSATRRVPTLLPTTPGAAGGNAIYRIDPNGFVTEVFRQPVLVLSLLEKDGTLLVGTGSEGVVYQVNPAAEETVALAKVDPKQVMSLLATKDGRVVLGLANVGGLASLSSGFAPEGTYTSPVLDAGQISRFGKIHLQGSLPSRANLTIATRSGNVQEPSDVGWSKWSEELPATEYVQIASPPARFLQYRLTFTSKEGTASAVVDEVDVAYSSPNQAPQIKAIRIAPVPEGEGGRSSMSLGSNTSSQGTAKGQASGRMRQITWEAVDPDNDAMEYTMYLRNGTRGPWILLQDKLKDSQYLWDTRGVADGRYQIKVTASDAKGNPRGEGREGVRVSNTVVVDNKPPVIGDLDVTKITGGVKIDAKVVDQTSTVASVEYSVDSKDDWQTVAASDKIYDSPEEGVSFKVEGLVAGAHQIALRATDAYGNQAYEAIQVVVESPVTAKE